MNNNLEKSYGLYKSNSLPTNGILEFDVFSDIHIVSESMEDELSIKWSKAIKCVKYEFSNSSGVMICGDFAESGEEYQFKTYFDILDMYNNDKFKILTAIGNHQVRWKESWDEPYSLYMKYNKKFMGETNGKIYFDKWIDGYHFIFLNTEWHIKDRSYISSEQLNWLDKVLSEKESEGKPKFLFLHQALRDTYWNSNEWEVGVQDFALKEILRKHPKNILFTGHIHNGLGKIEALKTEYGVVIDTPSFRSNDYGDSRGEIGYHVVVNETKVQICLYDYREHKWINDYNYIVELNQRFYKKSKVLDINFHQEILANDNLLNIKGEIINESNLGKALKIENIEEVFHREIFNEKILKDIILSNEVTLLFYAKINNDEWKLFGVTKDKKENLKIYINGELKYENIFKENISLNKIFLEAISKIKEEIKEILIGELKVYSKALGSAELETAYIPFTIERKPSEIKVSWKTFIDKEIEPAYVVLNGEKYCNIDSQEKFITIEGLDSNKVYTILVVDREKENHQNFRNAYSFIC